MTIVASKSCAAIDKGAPRWQIANVLTAQWAEKTSGLLLRRASEMTILLSGWPISVPRGVAPSAGAGPAHKDTEGRIAMDLLFDNP